VHNVVDLSRSSDPRMFKRRSGTAVAFLHQHLISGLFSSVLEHSRVFLNPNRQQCLNAVFEDIGLLIPPVPNDVKSCLTSKPLSVQLDPNR
jgi:hypothetical protein